MDYVQNKNVSMINEHKLGIFGTKNLEITKKNRMHYWRQILFSPTCLDQWLLFDLFMLRYYIIFEFVVC